MVKIGKKEKNGDLYKAILLLKDEKECYDFFQDLCTVSELRAMTAEYSGYRPLRRFKDCLNDPAAIRKANGRGGRKRNDLNGRLLSKEKRDLRRVRFSAGRTPTACLTAGS